MADNLITKRVAPGVARVSQRGTAHDIGATRRLDVGAESRVWAATTDSAFQLGQRKEYSTRDGLPRAIDSITKGHARFALADGRGVSLYAKRKGWRRLDDGIESDGLWWPLMTSDRTILALSDRGVWRLDDDEKTRFGWDAIDPPAACADPSLVEPSLGEELTKCATTNLVEAPDGSVWLGFRTQTHDAAFGGGLRRFDGLVWTDAPDPLDGELHAVTHLASYPGGPVWVLLVPQRTDRPSAGAYGRAQLARWDGAAWTRYELPSELQAGERSQPRELVAGPDGVVWLSRPLASFDGDTWRRYDTPARPRSKRPRVEDLSIGPDGSAWMVVRDNTKRKTTRPDGIYILDPERAKSTRDLTAVLLAATPDPA